MVLGWSYGDTFDKESEKIGIRKEMVNNLTSAFKMLTTDRVDIVPSNERNALSLVKSGQFSGHSFKALGQPINKVGLFNAFIKKSELKTFVNYYNEALIKLKNNGTIQRLKRKYNLQ